MKNLIVFYSPGVFDCYTILNTKTGDIYGASENPFHPQGFGQSCGNPAHTYFAQTVGAGWISTLSRRDPNQYNRIIKRKTAEIVQEFTQEGNLGKVIDFETLPAPVQQYCKQIAS